MDREREFAALMERVRAGSQEAARELYDRYSDAVRRVVRLRLEERLRRQYDSADFVQSVWFSFFRTPAQDYTFPTPEALVAFLAQMASNKVSDTRRKSLGTQRRGDGREESLDATPAPGQDQVLGETLAAPTHTPSQYIMANERWQHLVDGLPPGHRRILEMLREGHSYAEIADLLGMDRKIIQRLINRLREIAFPS
jgi:RNA polymerase sigma factor (sigma-70 family)